MIFIRRYVSEIHRMYSVTSLIEYFFLKVDSWNYAAEDVIHMGPYLQTLQMLHAGKSLTFDIEIEYIPHLSYRACEPVIGRIYPLYYKENNGSQGIGTFCIAPAGKVSLQAVFDILAIY